MEEEEEKLAAPNAFYSIAAKIGHPLEEIRIRALKNIIQKLELGLVTERQLARDEILLGGLLKWFNFTETPPPFARDVLSLLIVLSKHSEACERLGRLSAVEFFSKLRIDVVEEELQPLIDRILENLFLLPDVSLNEIQAEVPSRVEPVAENFDNGANVVPFVEDRQKDVLPSQQFSGFKLVSLKWVSVSTTDLHILQSTNSSIESDDVQLKINSCNFLTDVVIRDFPVEVFLQFSVIPRNLIEILSSNAKEPHRIGLHVLKCFSTLIRALLARVRCCRDVAMYNTKRDGIESSDSFGGSLDSRPSVSGRSDTRPRGDGEDGDTSPPSNDIPRNGLEDGWSDHSQEISVPDFCLLVLKHSIRLLNTPNPQVIHAVIEVAEVAVSLLSECITDGIWSDPSDAAQRVCTDLLECYDSLASIVIKQSKMYATSNGNAFKVNVAIVRCAASILANLMEISVSSSQACRVGISPTCIEALTLLCLDFVLSNTDGKLHRVFLGYTRSLDIEASGAYSMLLRSYESLVAAVRFVQSESSWQSLEQYECKDVLDFAEEALVALDHYAYWEFITQFIKLLSNFSSSDRSTEIFMQLLSHPETETRKVVFRSCLQLLEKSLGIGISRNPKRTDAKDIQFLLDTKILSSMIRYGLGSSDKEICELGSDIFLCFLNGRIFMPLEVWERFLNALLPIMPLIQAHTDVNATQLGIALFRFVDTDNKYLSTIDTLRCNIRLLFSKNSRLRSQVVPRIVWYLAKEENALVKLPPLSKLDASPLASVLVRQRNGSSRELLRPTRSYVSNEQVDKLLELFVSEECDISTRKVSGQRLTFVLNEEVTFQTFTGNGGVEEVTRVLQRLLRNDLIENMLQTNNICLIPTALELLRNAIIRDGDVLKSLRDHELFYYSLLRVALVFKDDQQVCCDVAEILTLLLFEDNFGYISLFESFDLAPRDELAAENNDERLQCIVLTSTDPLVKPLLETYSRYAWNAAMVGGWNNLTTTDTFPKSKRFLLNETDRRLLTRTRLDRSVESLFKEIIDATSHKQILVALKFLILDLSIFANCDLQESLRLKAILFDQSFSRFLKVYPKSTADKTLVRHILQFFTFVLRWQRPREPELTDWMYEQFNIKGGALYNLTRHPYEDHSNDTDDHSIYSPLIRELVTFIIAILSKTSKSNQRALYGMIHFVLQHLNLAEAPQFYNLASLEAVLRCLVHITARTGFSVQKTVVVGRNICRQLTALLMEVVASFHLSRENGTHSFMGRGVTTAATICLDHVATETCSITTGEAWIKDWFYVQESSEGNSQLGLGWLIPLWTHMDPEVRSSSLGIVVGFTATKSGCELVNANIQQVAGGLWGVALSFLLDHSEASIVREQAANILTNLMSHSMAVGLNGGAADSDGHVPLIGRAAVLTLLQNSNFIREMVLTLSGFTPHPWLQSYVQMRSDRVTPTSSLSTSCTLISTDFGIVNMSSLVHDIALASADGARADQQTNLTGSSQETASATNRDGFTLADTGLVSAVFLLLRNLVTTSANDTLQLMKQESLFECIIRILDQSRPVLLSEGIETNIRSDLLRMHVNVFLFLRTCCVADPSLRTHVTSNSKFFGDLLSYLEITTERMEETELGELWSSIYTLLTVICSQLYGVQAITVVDTLRKHIGVILSNLAVVLTSQTLKDLQNTAILWLVQTLSSLGKLIAMRQKGCDVAKVLSATLDTKGENAETIEVGSQLCRLLLQLYSPIMIVREKWDDTSTNVFEALGALFSVSQSAKQRALEDKFLDTMLERIKRNVVRLNVAVAMETKQSAKNKEQVHIDDCRLHVDLLTNFLFGNYKCKCAANELGLTAIVAQLWPVALVHKSTIFPSVLSLLGTFTSNCPPAAKSLALNKAHLNTGSTGGLKGANVGGTLLHEIIKVCQCEVTKAVKITAADNSNSLEMLFILLASVSLNPICRGIICKSKLLQDFTSQTTKKSGRLIYKESVLHLWLKLFDNITMKVEGQEVVLNIPDCIETLLDVIENGSPQSRQCCLNVLRNICFHPSAKTKFLGNAKLIKMLTSYSLKEHSDGSSDRQQLSAATALWALIANSQKGKVTLKYDNFVHELEDTLESIRSRGDETHKVKIAFVLETVQALIKE